VLRPLAWPVLSLPPIRRCPSLLISRQFRCGQTASAGRHDAAAAEICCYAEPCAASASAPSVGSQTASRKPILYLRVCRVSCGPGNCPSQRTVSTSPDGPGRGRAINHSLQTMVGLLNFRPATDYGTPTSQCGDDIESDDLHDANSCNSSRLSSSRLRHSGLRRRQRSSRLVFGLLSLIEPFRGCSKGRTSTRSATPPFCPMTGHRTLIGTLGFGIV
jgi:hypothetical protein